VVSLKRASMAMIGAYRRFISPMLPPACRFTPSCSLYMLQAIEKYGVLRGGVMGTRRLLRCHPFSKGGFDPVR
jgi:putative membrane protein insertion efficiency factor